MRKLITWIARYGDDLVAIFLTLILFLLSWQDVVGATAINNTILLVLAVMIAGNLRDRFNVLSMHRRILDELANASEVRILTGSMVATELSAARLTTKLWHFRGGTGTYLRAVTLPVCAKNSRSGRRIIPVHIEIIDPTVPEVCKLYAEFRTANGSENDEEWTTERTRKEAFATILASCWYPRYYQNLHVEVGLSTRVTTFRWDLSSSSIIQTQENTAGQAFLFAQGSVAYGYWQLELERSFWQARQVPIDGVSRMPLGHEPSVEEVLELFRALEMTLPDSYEDGDVEEIITKALKPPAWRDS